MSKGCKQRLTCKQYNLKHPTLLHITSKESHKEKEGTVANASSALVDMDKNGGGKDTVTGEPEGTLAAVPVKVKTKKGSNIQDCINKIPVRKENIPSQEDVNQWSYLREVKIPQIDADVGLLIGWKVINSQGNGTYTIKTILGWTINGPLRKMDITCTGKPVVTANRISVIKLENLLRQQIKMDFPEHRHEERTEMSKEDHKFMESVSKTVKLVDGHYCIGLPLREGLDFPNNRCVAEERALNLKRKFLRNSKFYEGFMADILDKGFAIRMTPEQKVRTNQSKSIWYIPHHGVFHPKKHKL